MSKLAWINLPVSAMSPEARKAYDAIEKATDAFEAIVIAEARKRKAIGAAETLRFSHKWGKVSMAKVNGTDANSNPWDALT